MLRNVGQLSYGPGMASKSGALTDDIGSFIDEHDEGPAGAGTDVPNFDVAICGFGPVGEVLANLLGRDGFRVVVFDREGSVYHLPRAAHLDHEIMRIFQSVDLAEEILPATTGVRGMHFLNGAGQKLFGFDPPTGTATSGWQNDYMFFQPQLESSLRRGVERYDDIHVHLCHEVVGFEQHPHHVDVRVRDLVTAELKRFRASFVVGCDGARSVIRRHCGIDLDDEGFDESWLVTDVVLREPVELPDVVLQICDPARPTTFVPMPGARRRWEFMLLPGEDPEAMAEEASVLRLLAPWLPAGKAIVERARVYTFHGLTATRWRDGRVLLAGDAAHQMPPFLGQGMCSGLRDAANLAWKLGMVLTGTSSDDLLDSYATERSAHVRAITRAAVAFGGIVCTLDPAVAAARDAGFLGNPEAAPGRDGHALLPPLGDGITSADVGGKGGAGRLFPQPWVRTSGDEGMGDDDVVRLDDLCGAGFSVIARRGDPRAELSIDELARLGRIRTSFVSFDHAASADDRLSVVADRDGVMPDWFESHDAAVVIVRPDRYVFGSAADAGDLPGLVDALTSQLHLVAPAERSAASNRFADPSAPEGGSCR